MDASKEPQAIDTSQISMSELPTRSFAPEREAYFRVTFVPEVHAAMWTHAKATLSDGELIREVGGVLLGTLYRDDLGPFLEITAAIAATHTRNEGTEVTFTPESWAEINRVRDTQYPDRNIVGWYHTHPSFGVFLSARDCFVHQHSFQQPWAVAHVIDPVANEEGLFVWQKGKPERTDEFWVGSGRQQTHAAPAATSDTTPTPSAVTTASPSRRWLTRGIVAAFVVGVALSSRYVVDKVLEFNALHAWTVRGLNAEDAELDRTAQLVDKLCDALEQVSPYRVPLRGEEDSQDGLRAALGRTRGIAEELRTQVKHLERITGALSEVIAMDEAKKRPKQGPDQ